MTGMTLYDQQGRAMLKMTDKISKSTGKVRTNGTNGSVAVGFPAGSKAEFFCMVMPVDSMGNNGRRPVVALSQGTLSWWYAFAARPGVYAADCIIHYGHY